LSIWATHLVFSNCVGLNDEYLSGMTFDEMTGADQFPQSGDPDDRRYQF